MSGTAVNQALSVLSVHSSKIGLILAENCMEKREKSVPFFVVGIALLLCLVIHGGRNFDVESIRKWDKTGLKEEKSCPEEKFGKLFFRFSAP